MNRVFSLATGLEDPQQRITKAMFVLADISSPEDFIAWMKRMNLSVTAVAQHLGRKRSTITKYINGESELPESLCRHAAVIEASRRGKPFTNRKVASENERASQPIGIACKMPF